jgi:hypothetical protein
MKALVYHGPGLRAGEARRPSPVRVGATSSGGDRMEALRAGSAQALTRDDVLEFLQRLSLDRKRSRALESGRGLLLEAVESGLVELGELDVFVGLMGELQRAGVVAWRCAPGDLLGDDLPHAGEFHLTGRGQSSLSASRGFAVRRSAPAYSSPIAGLLGRAR